MISPLERIAPQAVAALGTPCIIGATGGSGTRVFARIARAGGMYIGTKLAPSEDALPFREFFERWVNAFVDQTGRWEKPAPRLEELMAADLAAVLEEHCEGAGPRHAAWGWKAPRSIYLLPFWHRRFPEMRFLHVVRDGRDMAFSANQNQVLRHSGGLLQSGEEKAPLALRAMNLWRRVNLMAAAYGEAHLRERYLRVRFEDLCAEPAATVRRLYDFFGLAGDARRVAEAEVRPPESLGRWKQEKSDLAAEVERLGAEALRTFGYAAGG